MELEADNKGITEVLEKRNIFALNYIWLVLFPFQMPQHSNLNIE
jgi:hypothetical protein